MNDFKCKECDNNKYVYCYILTSNNVKQFRRVCTKCGLKDSATNNIKYSVISQCGYEPKEYTGKFYHQYLLKKITQLIDSINKSCPHCLSKNVVEWVCFGDDKKQLGIRCKKCLVMLEKPSGFHKIKESLISIDYLEINNPTPLSAPIWENPNKLKPKYYAEYNEYLNTEQWNEKKEHRLALDNNQCVLCFSTNSLHVHHVTYERLFDELPSDLMTVCKSCHETIHGRKL